MDPNIPTFVNLPRPWWPKEWIEKGFVDPVCPLRLALYGHPKSGDLWHEKLVNVLERNGFESLTEWPSLFFRRSPRETSCSNASGNPSFESEDELFMILVYVDDLLFSGNEERVNALR